MRIYDIKDNFKHEIMRDVLKRGRFVKTGRMQDKDTKNNKDFDTKELTNYSFCIIDVSDLKLVATHLEPTLPWCIAEFEERISSKQINPGYAWKCRKNIWSEFLEKNNGKFAYTYNERIRTQMHEVINELRKNCFTRQAIISIYNPTIDVQKIGVDRIPCSMYYQFLFREDKLHIIYNMRSCDVFTHYPNDIYLAVLLLFYIANIIDANVGSFYMNIGSLHAYKKDVVAAGEVF